VDCDLELLSEEARERLAQGEELVCEGNRVSIREKRYWVSLSVELGPQQVTELLAYLAGNNGVLSYKTGPAISISRSYRELDAHRRQHGG